MVRLKIKFSIGALKNQETADKYFQNMKWDYFSHLT